MNGKELESMAKPNWNPYYFAYALATGVKDPDEAFKRDRGNVGFMIWNSERWNETCKRIGVKYEFCSNRYEDHLETLASYCERA